jgi:hypothetical protein
VATNPGMEESCDAAKKVTTAKLTVAAYGKLLVD